MAVVRSLLHTVLFAMFLVGALAQETCPKAPTQPSDRREDKTIMSVATFNVAFLVDGTDDTNPARSVWGSKEEAENHISKVAEQIRRLDADVICLQEVESCEVLRSLNMQLSGMGYEAYLVAGSDSYTGQNVALLTRIDPKEDLRRATGRAELPPLSEASCGVGGSRTGDTSVSKNFFTTLPLPGGRELLVVCVHFKSGGSTDSCRQREAQSDVISGVLRSSAPPGEATEVVVLGDFNDFDAVDARGNTGTSRTLALLKDYEAGGAAELTSLDDRVPEPQRFTTATGMVDHILVSRGMLSSLKEVQIDHTDTGRTAGDRLANGYSDHFPLSASFATPGGGAGGEGGEAPPAPASTPAPLQTPAPAPVAECVDVYRSGSCYYYAKSGQCGKAIYAARCPKTCGACGSFCEDFAEWRSCPWYLADGQCGSQNAQAYCRRTCGVCTGGPGALLPSTLA